MYCNTAVLTERLEKEILEEKFKIYEYLGYRRLVVNIEYKQGTNYHNLLTTLKKLTNLEIFGKIIIKNPNLNNLRNILSTLHDYKDFIVAIESTDKEILTFGAKDSRIDVIVAKNNEILKNITDGIISLIKQHDKYLEISLNESIQSNHFNRSKYFRELDKVLKIALKKEEMIIYGGYESEINYIKGPREIIAIFHSIFDVPLEKCKRFLVKNPNTLIDFIKLRSNPNFLENGVEIIKKIPKSQGDN